MTKKIIGLGIALIMLFSLAACGDMLGTQSQISELKKDLERQANRILELEIENKLLTDRILDLENENEILSGKIFDLENIIPELHERITKLENRLAIKTITCGGTDGWGVAEYSQYDFNKLNYSTWHYNPYSDPEYSEPIIEMTFNEEQAIKFLNDLEYAGLFQLEKRYTYHGIVCDGGGWGIEVELANGDVFTSGGYMAYPPIKIQKAMDDAASILGNPKRFWRSAEDAEKYGYSENFLGSNTHNQYPGCTLRIDLKDPMDWNKGYRDSVGNAIDENYRLQRLVDMKKYYMQLYSDFIYDLVDVTETYPGGTIINGVSQRINPEFFGFDARFKEEGIEYSVDVNPYLPHIRIDFYGRQEYKDHLNNIEMTDMNYFESVINKLIQELKKIDTIKSAEVYWVPDWR